MSTFANRAVERILRSPLHPALSGKVQVIRYRGRRTGEVHTTPTQYVELDAQHIAILVGRPETKRWWHNFIEPAPMDLLIRGSWRTTIATTCWRADEPDQVDAALGAYADKYGARHRPDGADGSPVLVVFCDTVAEPQDRSSTNADQDQAGTFGPG